MNLRVVYIVALAAVVLGAPSLAQQRTWTVNAAGPGDFTEVGPAIDAANHGDTVLVLDLGTAQSPLVVSKGINLVMISHRALVVELTVSGLPVGTTFTLPILSEFTALSVENCLGDVHIRNVRPSTLGPSLEPTVIRVSNSSFVSIGNCGCDYVDIVNSTVEINGLYTASRRVVHPAPAYPALRMVNSDVRVEQGQLVADHLLAPAVVVPPPAVLAVGGSLRIGGDVLAVGGRMFFDWFSTGPPILTASVVESTGCAVELDPRAQVIPLSSVVSGTGTFDVVARPFLTQVEGRSNPGGPEHLVNVYASPGESAVIAVSLASPRLPTPFGDFWLDSNGGAFSLAMGVVDPSGVLHAQIDLEPLIGFADRVHWQGLVVGASGIRLTNFAYYSTILP